jgi:AcrR family transcriptional regulator
MDGRHARGSATRELILLAAERLFAEFGIAAVSLRDVGIAAGQKNNAAVQYHFGDKDNLVKEIVRYRVRWTDEMSAAFRAKLFSGPKPPQVADFVRGFMGSLTSNLDEGNYYIPFLSRFIIENGQTAMLWDAVPPDPTNMLKDGLRRLLPDCPDTTIAERWQILVTSIVHTLASYQTAHRLGTLSASLDHLLDDLIRFHSAGLEAAPRALDKPLRGSSHKSSAMTKPGKGRRHEKA